MNIQIETIPHKDQRYNTVGDWYIEDNVLIIKVSDMGNKDMEFLVAYHEITEARACIKAGITPEMVDEFDFEFEKNRKPGDTSEPGDDPRAPYYRQHQFATKMELMMCEELGVSWNEYCDRCVKISEQYPK